MRLVSSIVFVALPLVFAVPLDVSFYSLWSYYLPDTKQQRRDSAPLIAGKSTPQNKTPTMTNALGGLTGGAGPAAAAGGLLNIVTALAGTALAATPLGTDTSLVGAAGGVDGIKVRELKTLSAPLLKRMEELAIDIRDELETPAEPVSSLTLRNSMPEKSTPLSQTISPTEIQALADGTGFSVPEISSLPSAALPILEALAASNTRRPGGGLPGVNAA